MQTKLLVEAGANALVEDRWGHSPLDDAKQSQAMPVIAFLEPLVQQVRYSLLRPAGPLPHLSQ